MSRFVEISPETQIRILEMKLHHTEYREALATEHCIRAVKRQNRLTAELIQARRANSALLNQIHNIAGCPSRLMLPEVTR